MRVEKDFVDFIKLLNRRKVKYLIVGAYAVTYYSHPRNTGDIDFFIEASEGNAQKILRVLEEFGFRSLNIKVEDLLNPNLVIQLGVEPNRIDLITSISGVDFTEAYDSRVPGLLGRSKTYFISLDNLIKNKKSAKRKKDFADLKQLLKVKKQNESSVK